MQKIGKVLVTGAGGFIGHHLVNFLKAKGFWVRGVDLKHPEFEASSADEFLLLDLRNSENCHRAVSGMSECYHLAADMGGIGYITQQHALICSHNTMMNIHLLEAARAKGIRRFLFSSTACVYPQHLQTEIDVRPLTEADAYPANPEEGYGWEKLYMEKLCQYYFEDYGLETRIVRFHNVYGPLGAWEGGREKSPAAICRKIAESAQDGPIEVWGDGKQTRSYMYVEDCVEGVYRLMRSNYHRPINLGRDRMVSINELVDIVARIAGKRITKNYNLDKPQGVRGRNSDNQLLKSVLKWEPSVCLDDGLQPTYSWILKQIQARSEKIAA